MRSTMNEKPTLDQNVVTRDQRFAVPDDLRLALVPMTVGVGGREPGGRVDEESHRFGDCPVLRRCSAQSASPINLSLSRAMSVAPPEPRLKTTEGSTRGRSSSFSTRSV